MCICGETKKMYIYTLVLGIKRETWTKIAKSMYHGKHGLPRKPKTEARGDYQRFGQQSSEDSYEYYISVLHKLPRASKNVKLGCKGSSARNQVG